MASEMHSELADFHQFIAQQLGSKQANLSPEEALDLWREKHPAAEEDPDATEAVREALEDFEAGDRGIPAEEFDREFRKRHKLDRGP